MEIKYKDLPNHRVKQASTEPDILTSPRIIAIRPVRRRSGHPSEHLTDLTRPSSSVYPGPRDIPQPPTSRHCLKPRGYRPRIMCGHLGHQRDPLVTSAGFVVQHRQHSLSPVVEDVEQLDDSMGHLATRGDAVRDIPGAFSSGQCEPTTVAVDSTAVTTIVQELRKIGDDLDMRMRIDKEPQAQQAFWYFKRQFSYDLAMTLTFQHVARLVGTTVELCYFLSRL